MCMKKMDLLDAVHYHESVIEGTFPSKIFHKG